jgi:hypothetical protein
LPQKDAEPVNPNPVGWKKLKMIRVLKLLLFTALYVLALSFALKIIPFDNPPDAFIALFTKSSQSELTWMKIREVVIVVVMAWILALLIIRENAEKAQFDAVVVAILTVLWGFVFRWAVIGGSAGLSWYEVTDYLTTGLAVPVLVAVLLVTRGKRQHPSRA